MPYIDTAWQAFALRVLLTVSFEMLGMRHVACTRTAPVIGLLFSTSLSCAVVLITFPAVLQHVYVSGCCCNCNLTRTILCSVRPHSSSISPQGGGWRVEGRPRQHRGRCGGGYVCGQR
jgi:hypothetical protein